jgi:ribosome-binding factor A
MKGEVKDPRVNSLLTLVSCKVSKDLAYADIGVSGYMDTAQLLKGVDGLNSAAGFLQAGLGRVMKTRNTPRLRFNMAPEIQEGFELSKKIDSLLGDKEKNDATENSSTGSDPAE